MGTTSNSFVNWLRYSQFILCPICYKEILYVPELGKWTKVAALMSETLCAESTKATMSTSGPSGAFLYHTIGSSVNHIYYFGRAVFSYTIELPDYGNFRHVLPPQRVWPSVQEQ